MFTDWRVLHELIHIIFVALLDFSTPERLRVHLSSLSTPQFATSYTLGTVGLIDGSISYLFSTLPLDNTPSQSNRIPLRLLVPGYRQIYAPAAPIDDYARRNQQPGENDTSSDGQTSNTRKPTLLHATLHLPPPTTLNALFLSRLSPKTQLSLALCSSQAPSPYKSVPQASILAQVSRDAGKYSTDFIFSTDNALIGLRGLWNFGVDPRTGDTQQATKTLPSNAQSVSLVSAGGEFYYSPVSSVVGLSTGLRFATLPTANATSPPSSSSTPASSRGFQPPYSISTFPYTLTLTLTPLTGSLSTTYSLQTSPNLAFSSRFGFNVYSWESEMVAGCELWRQQQRARLPESCASDDLDWARRKMGLLPGVVSLPEGTTESSSTPSSSSGTLSSTTAEDADASDSVIKLRVDQSWNIRLLWEGRVKDLLVSAGVGLGPSSQSSIYNSSSSSSAAGGEGPEARSLYGWRGVGVSVSYSS